MAEAEVLAHDDVGGAQLIDQTRSTKSSALSRAELGVEGHDAHLFDAETLETLEPLLEGLEQRGRVRGEHERGVRIERDDGRQRSWRARKSNRVAMTFW